MSDLRNTSSKPEHRRVWLFVSAALLILLFGYIFVGRQVDSTSDNKTTPPSDSKTNTFDSSRHSTNETSSLWLVVNKKRPLNPVTYTPQLVTPKVNLKGSSRAQNMQLDPRAAGALTELFASAKDSGFNLMLSSGYRSYTYQKIVYEQGVKSSGQASIDTKSARPGYSEHQTGLAADVAPTSGRCDLEVCFGQLPEGIWVAMNAWRHGFVIRYPEGKTNVTGYSYEPWHLRYVGKDLSSQMHQTGIYTLEEFFGTGPAQSY